MELFVIVGTAYLLLRDKALSETQSGPFGQTSHYPWVITDEYGVAATHFQELSDKIIKESGCDLR